MVQGDSVYLCSEDMKACFFLFRLPDCWAPYFLLAERIPGWRVGRPDREYVYVGFVTIPMGWVNAVAVLQYLHRRLAEKASALPDHLELRRDAPVPCNKDFETASFLEYFVDNLDGFAIGGEDQRQKVRSWVLQVRRSGERVGVIYDDGAKRVDGEPFTKGQ